MSFCFTPDTDTSVRLFFENGVMTRAERNGVEITETEGQAALTLNTTKNLAVNAVKSALNMAEEEWPTWRIENGVVKVNISGAPKLAAETAIAGIPGAEIG